MQAAALGRLACQRTSEPGAALRHQLLPGQTGLGLRATGHGPRVHRLITSVYGLVHHRDLPGGASPPMLAPIIGSRCRPPGSPSEAITRSSTSRAEYETGGAATVTVISTGVWCVRRGAAPAMYVARLLSELRFSPFVCVLAPGFGLLCWPACSFHTPSNGL